MKHFQSTIEKLEQAFVTFMRHLGPKLSEDAESGLTGAQFYILHLLSQKEKFRVTEIANKMCVKTSAVTVMVERLHKNDWVARSRDEKDRRVVWIGLTDSGKEVLANAQKRRFKILAEYLQHLDPNELDHLLHIYEKLGQIAQKMDEA
ncbi:MarR family transcriptional regulator [Ammoniphilus oxalaticus]|uniref:MarR family transcriptional regulator n=1 Tax=Ammoniphilus oxalaticus TaxID=66863 RepID=A0A419SET5_9BACL|nr:MarR family transcriptional regulator [Ammoniphilus oxalaticus]RKD21839.1 MarR family transcriptional regulator [Ammoniphilus oxalaticus]